MATAAIIFALLTGGSAVALVAMMLRIGGPPRAHHGATNLPSPDEIRRNVLWRSFYVNPDDPRGWVPKTSGYGWTVNFRTRRNAAMFAALIALCAASAAALTATVLLADGDCRGDSGRHRLEATHAAAGSPRVSRKPAKRSQSGVVKARPLARRT